MIIMTFMSWIFSLSLVYLYSVVQQVVVFRINLLSVACSVKDSQMFHHLALPLAIHLFMQFLACHWDHLSL